MPDPSFDIVSEIDYQEVRNAVDQAQREISSRYDFKNTDTSIILGQDTITLQSTTEARIEAALTVLMERLAKRKVSQKVLDIGKVESAGGGTVKQTAQLLAGIDKEKGKQITGLIKRLKLKVQGSYQSDHVRVSGKKKDDLQTVMQAIQEASLDFPVQFRNRR